MKPIPVVDIFAGPGGLGEGFSRFPNNGDRPAFRICLSAEKDPAACQTLRLRAFHRLCGGHEGAPEAYLDYLRGTSVVPWDRRTRRHWQRAGEEARRLTLGTEPGSLELDKRVRALIRGSKDWVLIGGPPCQAYSLIGRSRNRGTTGYRPEKDHRHFLYREYLTILAKHRPSVFIMENVKGILSSRLGEQMLFPKILEDLSDPGKAANGGRRAPRYQIRALSAPTCYEAGQAADEFPVSDFVIRAEHHGIPQRRHRVILVGVREDIASTSMPSPMLRPHAAPRTVEAAVGDMPVLRSGISQIRDNPAAWRKSIVSMWRSIEAASPKGELPKDVAAAVRRSVRALERNEVPPNRGARFLASTRKGSWAGTSRRRYPELRRWLAAPRLGGVINHETRTHMAADLVRYLYASSFALVRGWSPRADEFPPALWPEHRNWRSGHFSDRFRVQISGEPGSTVTSHISKDGHYYIHPDPTQCRSFTVREAARIQTFPDDYLFEGNRTQQFVQVGNAVPPLLAHAVAGAIWELLR